MAGNIKLLESLKAAVADAEKLLKTSLGEYSNIEELEAAYNEQLARKKSAEAEKNDYRDYFVATKHADINLYALYLSKIEKYKKEETKLVELSRRLHRAKLADSVIYGPTADDDKKNRPLSNKAAVEEAEKLRDIFVVFEEKVGKLQKAVSVVEKNGGDRTGHYIRAIISEDALGKLRSEIVNSYEARILKPGEDRSQAEKNLTDPSFISEMLFSLSKNGETESLLFKELQMLLDLMRKRQSVSAEPEAEANRPKEEPKQEPKPLETVLRELGESRGWRSAEEAERRRLGFKEADRLDPENWKSLAEQLKQASEANLRYLQTHKDDLEKYDQAMSAWAEKQLSIWQARYSALNWARTGDNDRSRTETAERKALVSKRKLEFYKSLQDGEEYKELLKQNKELRALLANSVKEESEAFAEALRERYGRESAGKPEDQGLKAARRNIQTVMGNVFLPDEDRKRLHGEWQEGAGAHRDRIDGLREEQKKELQAMESAKLQKQLEDLEKRREKGEEVWPQILALLQRMASAEIEQVKLAEQSRIEEMPEELRNDQKRLAEWRLSQVEAEWRDKISEAAKKGQAKDNKELERRSKEIDKTAAAGNAKEDEAVKRERERLNKPAVFGSYAEIKQYQDSRRLEALQEKADERKAKNTEQAALDKQKLEEEARQQELDSEKALTESLSNLDASVKSLTEAFAARAASENSEGASALKSESSSETKTEATAETETAGGAAETNAALIAQRMKAILPYSVGTFASQAGRIFLDSGRDPVLNTERIDPLYRAREQYDRMARQVSSVVSNNSTSSVNTVQNYYIDGAKAGSDPDLRQLAAAVAKINERRERRERAFRGTW